MLPEMKYPGDTSLSEEIRERILKTFEQALDLADSGSHREALLGCDFVLRLDPLFEPARVLHRRLSEGGAEVEVADLRGHTAGGAASDKTSQELGEAPEPEPREQTGPVGAPPLAEAPISEPSTPPDEDLETVFHPVEEQGLEQDLAPDALGQVELDPSAVETPDVGPPNTEATGPTAYEAAAYETGSLQEPPESDASPIDEPVAEDFPPTEPLVEEDATQRVESPIEEHPITVPEAMLDDVEKRPAPPSAEEGFVTTFVDEPVAEDEGFGEDLVSSGEVIDEMAPPLSSPTQLDEESQRRIAALLDEGQNAFDIGEYQSAIDSWSRVFLIDIDHSEANRRIEQARRMAAEAERQIEEVFHEAISHLDAGDQEQARQALHRALELQPGHLAAQELLDRIDSGQAVPEPQPVEEAGAPSAGFEVEETYDGEEGGEDLFTAPDIVPAAAELEPPPPPEAPDTRKKPRQTFLIVGSIVLVLVIGGGWYLMNSWDSLFPNSDISQGEPAPQRIDPIARAKKLHEQGKTSIAIAQLRRLPPGDPHYAEGQALVAQWESAETGAEPEGPNEEEMARFDALVERAMQAHSQQEYLLVDGLLRRAAAIAPLGDEAQRIQTEAEAALEPLAEQIQVFRSGDWEYALPTLWRMRESDANNPNIERLIVDSYYNLGVRDLQRGNPGSALDKFEEALNLRPDDPTLTRLRAFAATYENRSEDLLYRIFVKYLPFR